MKNNLFLMAGFLFLASCSDGGSSGGVSFHNKNLALAVTGSQSFNSDIRYGRIAYYKISISADDMQSAQVEKFEGDSDSAEMLGVPVGADRTILVEAYNPDDVVIRRGQQESVDIIPGLAVQVNIVMKSVPIFTNIADRSAVSTNKLSFNIFGEPGSKLEVFEVTKKGDKKVKDENTQIAAVDTSSANGLFTMNPVDFDWGIHTFSVRDTTTGEESEVTLTLLESGTRPGIMVSGGGSLYDLDGERLVSQSGQAFYRKASVSADNLGNETFMDVMDTIF